MRTRSARAQSRIVFPPHRRLINTQLDLLGHSQIVDAHGVRLAHRRLEQGEGIVLADIQVGRIAPSLEVEDRFWIPKTIPPAMRSWFNENRRAGEPVYRDVVRSHRNKGADQIRVKIHSKEDGILAN